MLSRFAGESEKYMIYPSINDLSKNGRYNRYTLVIAVSKCARILTDEYVKQREYAEKLIANKETDKSLLSMIKREYRNEKAVKSAINRLYEGEFEIAENPSEESEPQDASAGENASPAQAADAPADASN